MAAGFTILPEFWMPFGEKEMEKKRKWNKKKRKGINNLFCKCQLVCKYNIILQFYFVSYGKQVLWKWVTIKHVSEVKCTIKKRRKRVCSHMCAHTHIHREKHILNKEKHQSQLNIVLPMGSQLVHWLLGFFCNAHVVFAKIKREYKNLGDAVINGMFPNCRNWFNK